MTIQLFDANYYRAANPDLASFNDDQALSHFQSVGIDEGRTFSAFVNLNYYRSSNSDLSNFSNRQAFEHLQNNGVAEGRRFSQFADLGFYRAANNDLQSFNNEQLLQHLQLNGVREGRKFSEFADLGFYRAANNDLQSFNNEQLFQHLQLNGVREGRKFSEFADLGFYRAANNDLQSFNNEQLLQHLELNGVREGRRFSQFVDLGFYRAANNDLQSFNNEQLLQHLELNGVREGRRFSQFADLGFYRAANNDLQSFNNEQLLQHLELNGVREGRQFSQFFDTNYYRSNNTDLAAANFNNQQLLDHFEINGLAEGRPFSVPFDVTYYRSVNPDLAAANLSNQQLYTHFQLTGLRESRVSSSAFNLPVYLANNPDLVAAGLDQKQAYEHFLLSGQSEGRPGSDYAGNTLSTARDITVGSAVSTFFDFVYSSNTEANTTDPDDYYSFNLTNVSDLTVNLAGLSRNANLRLIQDANSNGIVNEGEVIATSSNTGATPESIFGNNLAPGNYYIQVNADGGQNAFTHYSLNLSSIAAAITPDFGNNDTAVVKLSGNSNQNFVQFSLLNKQSDFGSNEFVAFTVDDDLGTINGIAPGAAGYLDAAIARGNVIFSTLNIEPNGFGGTRPSTLDFGNSTRFSTFLIKDGSLDELRAGKISTANVLFSSQTSVRVSDAVDTGFTYSFESDPTGGSNNFSDAVLRVDMVSQNAPTGSTLQAQGQGELLDFTSLPGQTNVTFTVNRRSEFENTVGFYRVVDQSGGIDTNNDGTADIFVGDAGYTDAALRNQLSDVNLSVANQQTATSTIQLPGGAIFAPFMITDGTVDQVLNGQKLDQVYFPFLAANADQADHIRLLGNNTFGFEDLQDEENRDFNDVIVQVSVSA